MGSVSTYLPAKLGGLNGEALKTGDVLEIGEPQGETQSLPKGHIPVLSNHIVLRARKGPSGIICQMPPNAISSPRPFMPQRQQTVWARA